jgi:predicted dehydrogenase/threonine dehydrogenase-like Zn-dependent dehydrogenase
LLQLLQHLGSGETELAVVPAPGPQAGRVLIRGTCSLVSLGTERMLVEFGRAGWFSKVRQQPEKFRAVLAKVRSEGIFATWSAVRSKLAQPIPLGYCHVGQVLDAGDALFVAGERVISNSPHAEVVLADPRSCARIPDGVSDEVAAFTPLAAIALQGARLLAPTAGDRVVVMGLGLVGQLAVQVLRALGCEVLGIDPDADKCAVSAQAGAAVFVLAAGADPVAAAMRWTAGQGAAGVLITASTASSDPVNQAARMCRLRGRVVLVGVTGLALNRADFYRQEISFQVSNSYGPRTDSSTDSAAANFQQVLRWMEGGQLRPVPLISRRHAFIHAASAYSALSSERTFGVLLEYDQSPAALGRTITLPSPQGAGLGLALIGAGNFADRTLLPALVQSGSAFTLRSAISAHGANALLVARRFHAPLASTDPATALDDPAVAAVLLCTRHADHATQAAECLRFGKAVWVEKPLALNETELASVMASARASTAPLMVGFNRRFAPLALGLRDELRRLPGPRSISLHINAGTLPPDHWTLNPTVGGGRIVGEVCHFVDLLRFLVGQPITDVRALMRGIDGQDAGRFTLTFADGTTAAINYLTDQPTHLPKEVIVATGADWAIHLDNWRHLRGEGLSTVRARAGWLRPPQKGHVEALRAFLAAVAARRPSPIPLDEIEEVSRWSIRMQGMLRS